ncbi:MAG: class I SAM-dependent methyltransferase [Planctomycetes bacterium]|nr:class I SAM-dependent methyltransferase [Planctomycetota bacterium]
MILERRTIPPPAFADVRRAYERQFIEAPYRAPESLWRFVARRFRLRRGERILEVGCGAGDFLAHLAGEGRIVWGLDIARAAAGIARRRAPDARIALARGERLPFRAGSFDRVLCLGSLEHFIEIERGARELARVVSADGEVWLLLPNSHYSGDIWRVIRGGSAPDHHQPIDRFATRRGWIDFLDACGLRVERAWAWNKGKRWKRLLPGALAYHFLFRCRRGQSCGGASSGTTALR